MTSASIPRADSPRVIALGTAAGALRASTGYGFIGIQRQARACAQHIARYGELPTRVASPKPITRWADALLLQRLTDKPGCAPGLFARLFDRAQPDALVRFLSESASWSDLTAVLPSAPAGAMLSALGRTIGQRSRANARRFL